MLSLRLQKWSGKTGQFTDWALPFIADFGGTKTGAKEVASAYLDSSEVSPSAPDRPSIISGFGADLGLT